LVVIETETVPPPALARRGAERSENEKREPIYDEAEAEARRFSCGEIFRVVEPS